MEKKHVLRFFTLLRKNLFIFVVMCICTFTVFAQDVISISGTVTDGAGEPLPGVNVVVKGTTIGVMTDIDGKYIINVPDRNAALVFSYVGFVSYEQVVGTQRVINAKLREDSQLIDEIVVVG